MLRIGTAWENTTSQQELSNNIRVSPGPLGAGILFVLPAINQILNGTVFWMKTHRDTLFRHSVHLYSVMFLILIIKPISLSRRKNEMLQYLARWYCHSKTIYSSGDNNGLKTQWPQNRSLSSFLKAWCFYGYWLLKAVQGLFCCSSPHCAAH